MWSIRWILKCIQNDYLKWTLLLFGITLLYSNRVKTFRRLVVPYNTYKKEQVSSFDENFTVGSLTQQGKETRFTSQTFSIKTKNKIDKVSEENNEILTDFNYPLNVDMVKLVDDVKKGEKVFHHPINIYKYKVIKNCKLKCMIELETSKLLLFVIKSAAQNFQQRRVIRLTWGKEIVVDGFIIRRVFFVGLSKDREVEAIINREYRKHDDLVQYDFYDQYFNNTLKTIGAINWITSYCKQVNFVLFVDDDYFVSPKNLVKSLHGLSEEQIKSLYMGKVRRFASPDRNPKRKWHVSSVEYPYPKYPPFINAGSYVMSIYTITNIQIAIQYTQLFRLDDVYLGIVAFKLNIELLANKNFRANKIGFSKEVIKRTISSHGFENTNHLKRAWNIYNRITK